MKRNDIINSLIGVRQYKSYLEIGVGDGISYNKIICEHKTNVDPCFNAFDNQNTSHVRNLMTSDEFFAKNSEKFDIIFVDGLHTYEQVYTDIINSLSFLNDGGVIVCHDMLPPTEWHQRPVSEYKGGEWNGDSWKAVARLRVEREDLEIFTIDSDWGCSVISKGKSKVYQESLETVLNYSYFAVHKKALMNVVSPEHFLINLT